MNSFSSNHHELTYSKPESGSALVLRYQLATRDQMLWGQQPRPAFRGSELQRGQTTNFWIIQGLHVNFGCLHGQK